MSSVKKIVKWPAKLILFILMLFALTQLCGENANAASDYIDLCREEVSAGPAVASGKLYSLPSTTASGTRVVATLSPGTEFMIDKAYFNTENKYWYHGTSSTGKTGYIYHSDVIIDPDNFFTTQLSGSQPDFAIGDVKAGSFTASASVPLVSIYVRIDEVIRESPSPVKGENYYKGYYYENWHGTEKSKSFSIDQSVLNNLPEGKYCLEIKLGENKNYYVEGLGSARSTWFRVWRHYFSVKEASTLKMAPDKTAYTIKKGNTCSISGTITSNYKISSVKATLDGTKYASIKPNSKTVDLDNDTLNGFKPAGLSIGTHKIKITASDGYKSVSKTITITVNPNTYTVKYNANGGTNAPASQTKTQGTKLVLSKAKPSRNGYTFSGWATSATGSVTYMPGATYKKDAAVTLYAVWEQKGSAAINSTVFPDDAFRDYVSQFDLDADGRLSFEELNQVTRISLHNKEGIASLTGLEYFTALTYLDCGNQKLTALNLSKNTALTTLNCRNNQLTSLSLRENTALKELDCGRNQLTSMDVSCNTALTLLYCDDNQLTALDVSCNTALIKLVCSDNRLTSLDLRNNTVLTSLSCGSNRLTSLDLRNNTVLTSLYCSSNQLTAFALPTSILGLYCGSNQISQLDLSDYTKLRDLYCADNRLTTLDVSPCAALTNLNCSSNQLTALNVSGCTLLSVLDCYSNSLSTINLDACPSLTSLNCETNLLTALDVSGKTALKSLKCSSNMLTALNLSDDTALESLICSSNMLTALDLSNNTALKTLRCSSNQLTELNMNHNTQLSGLYCDGNQLSALNISNCKHLSGMESHNNQISQLNIGACSTLLDVYTKGTKTEESTYYLFRHYYYLDAYGNILSKPSIKDYCQLVQLSFTVDKSTEVITDTNVCPGHDYSDTVIPPTCTEQGYTSHTCSVCGDIIVDTYVDALGHDWAEPEYFWNEYNTQVTASRVCKHDPLHVETETADVTEEILTVPDCDTMGTAKYTATFNNTAFESQSKTLQNVEALGHDYVDIITAPTCAEQGYTTHTCVRCGDSFEDTFVDTLPHNFVSTDTILPSCDEQGYELEVCSICGAEHTTNFVEALGHDWADPEYFWSDDNTQVTARHTCKRDSSHEESETVNALGEIIRPATCEADGKITYTGIFTDETFDAQTKTLDLTALGHDWGQIEYNWSEDNRSVTAIRPCRNDEHHNQEETVFAQLVVLASPTPTSDGSYKYVSAAFENELFTAQEKQGTIPALGTLNALILPANLKTIEDESFAGSPCQAVIIPDGCTAIGSKAFADCKDLVYVYIPASVTALSADAFDGCPHVIIDRP